MKHPFFSWTLTLLGVVLISLPAMAGPSTPASFCNLQIFECDIYENATPFHLPFVAVSGDVVLLDADGTVSDVFRIFNDVFNSGKGTGQGDMAILYSEDQSNLPKPSKYSANVIFLQEGPLVAPNLSETDYFTPGLYRIFSNEEEVPTVPEPAGWEVLGAALLAMAGLLRNRDRLSIRLLLRRLSLWMIAAIVCLGSGAAFGKGHTVMLELANGTHAKTVVTFSKNTQALGPNQSAPGEAPAGLPFYTAKYKSFGRANLFNIVGTDPSLGANTTIIPTVIIPLKFIFQGAGNAVLDGTNVAVPIANSPIFLTADYTTGGTDIGVTQYGDAIQRAEFWNLPGFSRAGYHVLLGTPTIAPTVTITVPVASGSVLYL